MVEKKIVALLSPFFFVLILASCGGGSGGGGQAAASSDGTNQAIAGSVSSDPSGTSTVNSTNQSGTGGIVSDPTGTNTGGSGNQTIISGGTQTVPPSNVSLAWNAPTTYEDGTPITDLAGFKVYYGTSSGVYSTVIDVQNVTSYTTPTLAPGTYYFAVTCYDSCGSESVFSNELTTTISPQVAPSASFLRLLFLLQ